MLLPNFLKSGCNGEISSKEGVNATKLAKKYGIEYASTDYSKIFKNKNIDTIVIGTTHDTHYELVKQSIENSKNIFVEKPLCLNNKQLDLIKKLYEKDKR